MEMQSKDINDDIVKELQCPVCLEYLTSPIILVCNNGHNVCSKCAPQLEQCATCRQPKLNIRNVALENVARQVKFPCHNRNWGCKETFPATDIIEHETLCFHSKRVCPYTLIPEEECDWTGSTNDLIQHLSNEHQLFVVEEGQKMSLSISTYGKKTMLPERVIKTLEKNFILSSSFGDNEFCCIVQHIGAVSESSNYKYKFSVSNQDGSKKISFTNKVRSDVEDLQEMRQSGECIVVPRKSLQGFYDTMSEERYTLFPFLKYTIKISEIRKVE